MTRPAFPYQVEDISQLARSLQQQLEGMAMPPSHLALMNMLARGAGYKNFQHFRNTATPHPISPAPDMARVEQAMRHFDHMGRLARWPGKTWTQHLCLWGLWARLPNDLSMTEREISAVLNQWHLFEDAAILRRTLCEMKLVTRGLDGRDYRRVALKPPPEARALLRALKATSTAAGAVAAMAGATIG